MKRSGVKKYYNKNVIKKKEIFARRVSIITYTSGFTDKA